MKKIGCLGTHFMLAAVLLPSPIAGQNTLVSRDLGATVATAAPVKLTSKPLTIRVTLQPDCSSLINEAMKPTSKTKLTLTLEGVRYDKMPDFYYEIYVNLPDHTKPEYGLMYLAGNLLFFEPQAGAAESGHVSSFDVTKTVRALKAFKSWNDKELSITFVMHQIGDSKNKREASSEVQLGNLKFVAITAGS